MKRTKSLKPDLCGNHFDKLTPKTVLLNNELIRTQLLNLKRMKEELYAFSLNLKQTHGKFPLNSVKIMNNKKSFFVW